MWRAWSQSVVKAHSDDFYSLCFLHSGQCFAADTLALVSRSHSAGDHLPYPYPFDRTALFYRLVATHTTIPMPEVLAIDVSYQVWPWRYLITTYLPGQEWALVQSQMNQQELGLPINR